MTADVASSVAARAAGCVLLAFLRAPFVAGQAPATPALTPMPRALETALALSAAPPYLRDSAGVYVLDPSRGYLEARAGTNGFRCLVARTEWEWPQLAFRDDIFVPVCSDAAGAAAWLPVLVDVAAMRAHGDSPRAVYDEVMRRFADGRYHAPARAGISYMLSPVMRTYLDSTSREPTTMVGPHFMFYAPNVTDADIGGRPQTQGPFMLSKGPHALIFVSTGAARKQEILAQSRALLADLCAYSKVLCVPQTAAPPHAANAASDSVPPLARFFVGAWRCSGGTPAGRVLDADVDFTTVLGDRFIQSAHRDEPPGRYLSSALWPTDTASRRQATVVYDNFGGHRRFTSGPWSADSIVWVRDTTEEQARMETFTYRRAGPDAYWYAWHVRRAAGGPLVLGDSATCRRKP
jgi:hypothetical protein